MIKKYLYSLFETKILILKLSAFFVVLELLLGHPTSIVILIIKSLLFSIVVMSLIILNYSHLKK